MYIKNASSNAHIPFYIAHLWQNDSKKETLANNITEKNIFRFVQLQNHLTNYAYTYKDRFNQWIEYQTFNCI